MEDHHIGMLELEKLLTTCYLHTAYIDANTATFYGNDAVQALLLESLNNAPEYVWFTNANVSRLSHTNTDPYLATKWNKVLDLGYDIGLMSKNDNGYIKYKRIAEMSVHQNALVSTDLNVDLYTDV